MSYSGKLNKQQPAFWTDQWLRELSWSEVRYWNSKILKLGVPLYGASRRRCLRLQAEYARRKKEGGGGLTARPRAERKAR
jgi:hypothetical protein